METNDSVTDSDRTRNDIAAEELPAGVDRRTFLMRSAVVGAS